MSRPFDATETEQQTIAAHPLPGPIIAKAHKPSHAVVLAIPGPDFELAELIALDIQQAAYLAQQIGDALRELATKAN